MERGGGDWRRRGNAISGRGRIEDRRNEGGEGQRGDGNEVRTR
jgi:hypothetical protein